MSCENIKKICGLDEQNISSYFGQNRRYNNIRSLITPRDDGKNRRINEGSIEAVIPKEQSVKKYPSGKFSARSMGKRDLNDSPGEFSDLAMMETSRARTARGPKKTIDSPRASGHSEMVHSVLSYLKPKGGNHPEDGAKRVSRGESVKLRTKNTLTRPEMAHQYHTRNSQ
jgi:hypothetical protein